eukprot:scaffold50904_cov19-Tisochrysis_lutea.AAC.1
MVVHMNACYLPWHEKVSEGLHTMCFMHTSYAADPEHKGMKKFGKCNGESGSRACSIKVTPQFATIKGASVARCAGRPVPLAEAALYNASYPTQARITVRPTKLPVAKAGLHWLKLVLAATKWTRLHIAHP